MTDRIEGLRVADVMDAEPVAIPAELTLDRAEDEYFLRYGYPWFPVVDAGGRFVGLVTQGSRGVACPRRSAPGRTVASVMAADGEGESRHARGRSTSRSRRCWACEGLVRLGAIMAVDREGAPARHRDRGPGAPGAGARGVGSRALAP